MYLLGSLVINFIGFIFQALWMLICFAWDIKIVLIPVVIVICIFINKSKNTANYETLTTTSDPRLDAAKAVVSVLEDTIKKNTDMNSYFGDVCYVNFYRDKKSKCEKEIEIECSNFQQGYDTVNRIISLYK